MKRIKKILSVIIPSYNMETYLPSCLSSLILDDEELFRRLDVIVVNDGSKDHTSAVAHKYNKMYPHVFRVIDKDNGHYGSCVNVALPVVEGEYVKILDADDSYDKYGFARWLKLIANKIDAGSFKDVDLIVTDFATVDGANKCRGIQRAFIPQERILDIAQIPRHYVFQMHAIAYRTEMIRSLGYVQSEGIMYTDTEWSVYPMAGVHKLYYSPIVVYRYLIAREGQSMDVAVFERCLWQRIKMYMRMARESQDGKWAGACYRMKYQMLAGMRSLYLGAVGQSLSDFNARMLLIDNFVNKFGHDVYQMVDEITLSMFKSLRVVKSWRRKRHVGRLYYAVIRCDALFAQSIAPIKQLVKKVIR